MPGSLKTFVIVAVMVLAPTALTRAADDDANWPQWRGPTATGAAPASANPPTEWSETKNVRWKVAIPGEGAATPVVWGDQVFVQTAIPTGKESAPAAASPAAQPRRGGGRGFGG